MQRGYSTRGIRFLAVIFTIGLITAVANYQVAAADVFTDPVGFITLTSTAATVSHSPAYSYLGLGMTQIPTNRGVIAAVSGNMVTVSNLTAAAFNQTSQGAQFYIEDITSNGVPSYAGLTDDIVSNDANNVFLSTSVAGLMAAGDNYKIFPHWSLNTVFGNANQYGIVYGSNTSAQSDNIVIWNPVNQNTATYFYRSLGSIGWRGPAGTATDAGNTPLYLDQGIQIVRKRTVDTNVNFLVVGAVKLGPTITTCPSGATLPNKLVYVPDMYASSVTLNSLNLYTGNPLTGVFGSNTSAQADNVIIWNPVLQNTTTYFYRSLGSIGWRGPQGTAVEAGTNVLALGSVIKIQHKVAPAFNWTLPAQY